VGSTAAGAPGGAVQVDEAGLVRRYIARAAANVDGSVNERQLVVGLKQNYQAVLQLNARGLLRMERVQRRHGNFFPSFRRLLLFHIWRDSDGRLLRVDGAKAAGEGESGNSGQVSPVHRAPP